MTKFYIFSILTFVIFIGWFAIFPNEPLVRTQSRPESICDMTNRTGKFKDAKVKTQEMNEWLKSENLYSRMTTDTLNKNVLSFCKTDPNSDADLNKHLDTTAGLILFYELEFGTIKNY